MVYERRENYIKFSEEFDKLRKENRVVGKTFTTFRGYKPFSHRLYSTNIDESFKIVIGDSEKLLGHAYLREVHFTWSDEVDIELIRADTYSYEMSDWENNVIKRFYRFYPVFLISLDLEWCDINE